MNFLKTTLLTTLATVAVAQTYAQPMIIKKSHMFVMENAVFVVEREAYNDYEKPSKRIEFAVGQAIAESPAVFDNFAEALACAQANKKSSFIIVERDFAPSDEFAADLKSRLADCLMHVKETNERKPILLWVEVDGEDQDTQEFIITHGQATCILPANDCFYNTAFHEKHYFINQHGTPIFAKNHLDKEFHYAFLVKALAKKGVELPAELEFLASKINTEINFNDECECPQSECQNDFDLDSFDCENFL